MSKPPVGCGGRACPCARAEPSSPGQTAVPPPLPPESLLSLSHPDRPHELHKRGAAAAPRAVPPRGWCSLPPAPARSTLLLAPFTSLRLSGTEFYWLNPSAYAEHLFLTLPSTSLKDFWSSKGLMLPKANKHHPDLPIYRARSRLLSKEQKYYRWIFKTLYSSPPSFSQDVYWKGRGITYCEWRE